MKKIFFLLFVAVHFACIIYTNIISEEQALTRHFTHKKVTGKAFDLLDRHPVIFKAYSLYSFYTGTETGYGFYAPNVSNQVICMFTVKDKNNRVISMDQLKFHSKDAYLRSLFLAGKFVDQPSESDTMQRMYLKAVMKSMALWALDTHPGARKIETDLLVYDIPVSFEELRKTTYVNYIKLGHYEYAL